MRFRVLLSVCFSLWGCHSKGGDDAAASSATAPVATTATLNPALGPMPPPRDTTAPSDVAAPPPDAQKTKSGITFKVVTPGEGSDYPKPDDLAYVGYTGWSRAGKTVEDTPAPILLRIADTAPAFAEMLPLMVTGEKRRLWVPGALIYGEQPTPNFPPGDLTYDLTLGKIKHQGAPPPTIPAPADVKEPPKSAKRTKSGLAYRVLKPGTGKQPTATDSVSVNYSGWTTDGKMFDSSIPRKAPLVFRLDQVIKGWTEGVQLMKVGETARFWIPADLAYGEKPSRPGAPSGMLVFDIELLEIK